MMETILLFLPASMALNLAFGPNNLLALTHGAQHGPRFAIAAAMGRLVAFAPMIALSAAGMGLLLASSVALFTVAKLVGAAYLIWLGIRLWRARQPITLDTPNEGGTKPERNFALAFRREVFVALGNPKAILVFAAFLPQFVRETAYWQDYALFGGLFLLCEVVAVAVYAGAGKLVQRGSNRLMARLQRLSGLTIAGFGVALLFARRPVS